MSHTAACRQARTGKPLHGPEDVTPDWPMMSRLSEDEQGAVLDCSDGSHDSVRAFLRERPWTPPGLVVR